jgi:hypothetical protein
MKLPRIQFHQKMMLLIVVLGAMAMCINQTLAI